MHPLKRIKKFNHIHVCVQSLKKSTINYTRSACSISIPLLSCALSCIWHRSVPIVSGRSVRDRPNPATLRKFALLIIHTPRAVDVHRFGRGRVYTHPQQRVSDAPRTAFRAFCRAPIRFILLCVAPEIARLRHWPILRIGGKKPG